jgi:dihydrodipicolinate synthase/N-acetylneuraminate lyase
MTAGAIGVMSITPFDEAGSVEHSVLRSHLERLAAHPVSIYVCSQGSGEGLGLSLEEKEAVYRTAVDVAAGRCEVIGAGIGIAGDTATAVDQLRVLSGTGVAGGIAWSEPARRCPAWPSNGWAPAPSPPNRCPCAAAPAARPRTGPPTG